LDEQLILDGQTRSVANTQRIWQGKNGCGAFGRLHSRSSQKMRLPIIMRSLRPLR